MALRHSIPLGGVLGLLVLASLQGAESPGDWADWRGPARDGISPERNLPNRWSPSGDNLSWRAPYGGRSAPIVVGDRLFLQNSVGQGPTLQERVMCFHADTGKLLWERRFNVYLSDVPPHRVGWSSPAADPTSGAVFVFGVGGHLAALGNDGKLLWERSLGEEFGLVTTHGGRTVSPVIEGDLVIVSGVTSGWGAQSRAGHRFMAFDKETGDTVWVGSPGGRPYDTTYSPPLLVTVGGTPLLIAGGSDGAVHALKPLTGEPVWRYEISKRGLNTGVVVKGTTAFVTHSEENLGTSEMGLVAAVDATARGDIGKAQVKWSRTGFQGGFSSPVLDGNRLYQVDNGANLAAFDVDTGKQLWLQNLGTIQKASPVLADGKLYVGTENGKFFILRPGADRCEILDEDQLGTEAAPEAIVGSVAVSRGRVFLVTNGALYAIGRRSNVAAAPQAGESPPGAGAMSRSPAYVQVFPTELALKPGEGVRFQVRLFDQHGRRTEGTDTATLTWSLDQLRGAVDPSGRFVAAADAGAQAGQVKAAIGSLSGASRVRIVPPPPWRETFEGIAVNGTPAHWINTAGKFASREIGGNKVLVKLADNPFTKRARAFVGPSNWSDYTVEVDVRATERRRQMGDAGVVAQRYQLALFGSHQRLELQSWQPETTRTVTVPFAWKADTWYRMKLEAQNLPDGKVRVRGRVWPVGEAEPSAWQVERIDGLPNRQGAAGLYADAPYEIFFDNFTVTSNRQ